MMIGVTGAGGFIGRKLCEAFVAKGYSVRALTRNANLDIPSVEVYSADLAIDNESKLEAFLDGVDVVVHCAGELKNDELMYALHVEGTKRLLAAVNQQCVEKGRALHWVQLSSVGAYGPPQNDKDEMRIVSEKNKPSPKGVYEITKTISDELVLFYSELEKLFTCTVIRPSNVIGASMPNRSFFQLASVVRRKMFFYIGAGDSIATYVHVDDVVDALVRCSFDSRAINKTYIISNDCLLRDVIGAIAKTYNIRSPTLRLPVFPLRLLIGLFSGVVKLPLTHERIDALVVRTQYSSKAIEDDLGFSFSKSIPDAVGEILTGSPVRSVRDRS